MSIEQTKVIDFIGTDNKTGNINLGVSDHLDWKDPKNEHLLILQEKINTYLAFIESGQLYEEYPSAKGKRVIIRVIGKYPLSEEAKKFYKKSSEIVAKAGFELRFDLFKDGD